MAWVIVDATGTSHTDGSAIVWDATGTAARYVIGKWDQATLTPYQTVKFTLSGLMEQYGRCGNMLIGNAKADFSEFVYLMVIYNKLELGYYNGGVGGWGNSANYHVYPSGSLTLQPGYTWALGGWSLQCGSATSPNQYIAAFQGATQLAVTDSSAHIAADSNHLYSGQAFFSDARSPIEAAPGKVSVWQVLDSSPVAVVGSGMRAFRTSTTAVTTTVVGQEVPASFFDNLDYCSADITWDAPTCRATVSKPGMYFATVCLGFDQEYYNTLVEPLVYVNGTYKLAGPSSHSTTASAPTRGVWFNFPLPLKAGDAVSPGIYATATVGLTGESTGTITYFALTKVG